MAKHGNSGLGYEIVKAVANGAILEPITYEKVKLFCEVNKIDASEKHMRVILPNASENSHSPTYKKYFERVGRGQYVVLPEFKSQKRFYWLNIDSTGYEWTFTNKKLGTTQTFSNLNINGNKRKNPRCFREITVGDLAVAYETGDVRAITTICKVTDKYEEDHEISVEFRKISDYEFGLELDSLIKSRKLEDCEAVHFHRGTLFEIEHNHFDIIAQMLKEKNKILSNEEELYRAVKQAMKKNKQERLSRLNNRDSVYPDIYEVLTKAFRRDPDVIAEVLIRANGTCEKCGKEAPFKRASDGSPYLEVHHKKRLADGGEDTTDNAIAVCPNCHRELHFG
ncbi:HNH endonuclease [Metabacillus litoralis]|uniref:HNH endonuclease n=1 Tax=Metabacillus litoralis TaxID=152268 RepID=UPI0020407D6C|nr:HNH endonuclease [Metabacillus litoralis]MCM3163270.1 EVE domain-containing protein [Metabacillus litoralis]